MASGTMLSSFSLSVTSPSPAMAIIFNTLLGMRIDIEKRKPILSNVMARTVLDTAPYEIPADDPTLQTDMDAKTTVYSWRDDYDDITDDKSLSLIHI